MEIDHAAAAATAPPSPYIYGIELVPDAMLVKDLETIKSLLQVFQSIGNTTTSKSIGPHHMTFMQLVQDSSLVEPTCRYTIENSHRSLLDRQACVESELQEVDEDDNAKRVLLLAEQMEIQQTINDAQLALNAASRSLAARVDDFLCMWVLMRLSCSPVLLRAVSSRCISSGSILLMWQKELRRRCLVCPFNVQ